MPQSTQVLTVIKKRQTTLARVRQLRLRLLVHSYIYYQLNETVISDHQWQHDADELVRLQKSLKVIGCYDEAFADWDASTGYHLPQDHWVHEKALYILKISKVKKPAPLRRAALFD